MLTFHQFFDICNGAWTIERTYHYLPSGEVERSHTEYQVQPLANHEKQSIINVALPAGAITTGREADCPGFAIAFDTVSETGDRKTMNLKTLFVLDDMMPNVSIPNRIPNPIAAQMPAADGEMQQGYYLRDQGYSESGAIAGRFTYQPTRRTLEMTTVYSQSVSVDQMRIIDPTTRLRTIVTYERPVDAAPPSVITLTGFGLERKTS